MAENVYKLDWMLLKEYVPAVERALEHHGTNRLLREGRKTAKLLNDFKFGSVTLEQAQEILALVILDCDKYLAKPGAGRIAETSLMVGARSDLAMAVQTIRECERDYPAEDNKFVETRVFSRILDKRSGRG